MFETCYDHTVMEGEVHFKDRNGCCVGRITNLEPVSKHKTWGGDIMKPDKCVMGFGHRENGEPAIWTLLFKSVDGKPMVMLDTSNNIVRLNKQDWKKLRDEVDSWFN